MKPHQSIFNIICMFLPTVYLWIEKSWWVGLLALLINWLLSLIIGLTITIPLFGDNPKSLEIATYFKGIIIVVIVILSGITFF